MILSNRDSLIMMSSSVDILAPVLNDIKDSLAAVLGSPISGFEMDSDTDSFFITPAILSGAADIDGASILTPFLNLLLHLLHE